MQAGSCHVRLCGPPVLCGGSRSGRRLRHKAIALIAYLAVEARPIGRDTLATLLWPFSGQSAARANLRAALHDAKYQLPSSALVIEGDTLELNPHAVLVDIWQLREIALRQAHCEVSIDELARTAEICAGEFLEGFTLRDCREFDSWQLATAGEIRQQMALVFTRLVRMRLEAGDYEEAIAPALRLVGLDPLEESSHRLAIETFARCGKWAAAVVQFEQCRKILADELAVDPAEETVRLIEEVLAHSARFGAGSSLSLRSRSYQRPPILSNRFFGRSEELDEIRELIRSGARIVTLTGPAGIGKTRLAIEAAQGLDEELLEGAVFADLTAISAASDVPRLIAQSIGLQQRFDSDSNLLAALSNQLDRRRVLLILDNFEHVIPAAAVIAELLQETQIFQVLTTSREPLHIQGEQQVRLAPLGVSPESSFQAVAGSPAVRLFEDRARSYMPDFSVSQENYEAVQAICIALDGVPLALELAVPLLQLFTPEELPVRLATPLGYLTHGSRDTADRHRTLEMAIAWSYDLLARKEQRLLLELSAFANSFDLPAVEAVCDAASETPISDILHSLLDKSLIQLVERSPARRFGLLQATREFAAKRRNSLPCLKDLLTRHANYYCNLALRAEGELHGPDQIAWIDRLGAAHPNILISLSFLRDHNQLHTAMKMAVALSWFWYRRGYLGLARQWLYDLTELCEDSPSNLRARALHSLGWFTFLTGDWGTAHKLYETSLHLCRQVGDMTTEAYALSDLGVVERWLGNASAGDALVDDAVRLARKRGTPADLTRALIWAYATTGGVFRDCYPERELLEARLLAIETGDHWLLAHSYNGLGDLYCENKRYAEARSNYDAALQGFRKLGDRVLEAWTLEGMGRVEIGCGDQMAALRQTAQALSLFDGLGDALNVGLMMARIVGILRELGSDSSCVEIAGAAAALIGRHRRDDLSHAPQIDEAMHHIAGLEKSFPSEWSRGQSLSRADAVDLTQDRIARLVHEVEMHVTPSRPVRKSRQL